MKAYELLFIVAPTIDEENRAGVMKRIETAIAAGEGKRRGASANSLMRSMVSPTVITPSLISTLIPSPSPSSIACCASPMPWCVT